MDCAQSAAPRIWHQFMYTDGHIPQRRPEQCLPSACCLACRECCVYMAPQARLAALHHFTHNTTCNGAVGASAAWGGNWPGQFTSAFWRGTGGPLRSCAWRRAGARQLSGGGARWTTGRGRGANAARAVRAAGMPRGRRLLWGSTLAVASCTRYSISSRRMDPFQTAHHLPSHHTTSSYGGINHGQLREEKQGQRQISTQGGNEQRDQHPKPAFSEAFW